MSERQAPAPRDQQESPFSRILEGFWRAHGSVLAAAFVDGEGECIDYFSSLEPFEAKVAGAHMAAVLPALAERCLRAGLGAPRVWTVEAELRDLVVAPVGEDYAVVLILHARGLTARVLEGLDGLIEAFSLEAGVASAPPPSAQVEWQPSSDGVAEPAAIHVGDAWLKVARVLARWSEAGLLSEEPRRCFRVRLEKETLPPGMAGEVTLVHDPHLGRCRLRIATK